MARKISPRRTVQAVIPAPILKKLARRAAAHDVSVSRYICQLIVRDVAPQKAAA